MANIILKKGLNIRISGIPKYGSISSEQPETVSLSPKKFRYVKPKLLVNEGDQVKIGSPLFLDKLNPLIQWGSPGSGKIDQIIMGERRTIEQIIVKLDKEQSGIESPGFKNEDILKLGKDKATQILLNANVWPIIRQRPFNKIANPENMPKSIFISGWNTAPLSVNLDFVIDSQAEAFQAGINVLTQLTSGDVNLSISKRSGCSTYKNLKNVKIHTLSGPHPIGNVGIQIHHIDALKPGEIIWTVDAQQVIMIGHLFLTGEINPEVVVSVAGPGVSNPAMIKTRMGAPIAHLVRDRLKDDKTRIISGDVLTGMKVGLQDCLGYYHTSVTVIPVSHQRKFLTWLMPGTKKSVYSASRAYLNFGQEEYEFSTLNNGAQRALVPIEAWEQMLPMDILPNPLYRSILANDVVEMESLGLLECDEEDFALCSFACPSKIDLGGTIRMGLDLLEKES